MDDRVSLWGGLPDKSKAHITAKRPGARARGPGEPRLPWDPDRRLRGIEEFDQRHRIGRGMRFWQGKAKTLRLDTSKPIGWKPQAPSRSCERAGAPRAGRRSPGMGRSRSRAGLFAFMFVVSAAPSLYGALTSPTTFDYWKDRFWTPSLKAVPLRNAYVDSGGSTHVALVVTGEIGRASAATLSAAIDRAGLVVGDAVVLSSPGGDLDQALIMGEEIRRRGLLTVVGSYATGAFAPSYCASACVAVFAGGVHRIQARGSRMGVHQFATVGTTPDDPVAYAQRETGDLMAYFTRMGVDAMVVQAGSGSREMRWLTPDEVTRLRLSDFDVDTM